MRKVYMRAVTLASSLSAVVVVAQPSMRHDYRMSDAELYLDLVKRCISGWVYASRQLRAREERIPPGAESG